MGRYFKFFLQAIFFCLFVVLVITGKMQVWMLVFVGSLFAALLLGRVYCGWICPINTGIEWIDRLYKHLGIKRKPVPSWIKKPFVRYMMLSLFLIAFVTVFVTGKRLPVLPVLFIIGIMLSLLFVPSLWHRYLCPYGVLLHFTGFFARKSYKVDADKCIKCGICKKACPAEAAEMKGNIVFPEIKPGFCLVCSACSDACPKKAISYK